MAYKIEVDFAPSYELLISFVAYMNKNLNKGTELGSKWRQDVRKTLSPAFAEKLDSEPLPEEGLGIFYLLAGLWPKQNRTCEAFLDWLEGLTPGDLFEMAAPHVDKMPADLPKQRDTLVPALREWNEQYFSRIDAGIIEGLNSDADAKSALQTSLSPEALYEEATNGIRQEPSDSLRLIRIVPQYHLRPMIHSTHLSDMIISFYSCDALPPKPGQAPASLVRTLRCLSDESRLQMLSMMARQNRTFTELVKLSGLSKSTVHHHLVALRAAGLVRLEAIGSSQIVYSLRTDAIDRLGGGLKRFLQMD